MGRKAQLLQVPGSPVSSTFLLVKPQACWVGAVVSVSFLCCLDGGARSGFSGTRVVTPSALGIWPLAGTLWLSAATTLH